MMTRQKLFLWFIGIFVIVLSFTGCCSTYKLQDKASFKLEQITYYKVLTNEQTGRFGINLEIPVVSNKNNVVFDSIYFRGHRAKMEKTALNYTAYIKLASKPKEDLIMSGNSHEEFGNFIPLQPTKFPFKLASNACVIRYIENKTIKYVQVKNLLEKPRRELQIDSSKYP